MADEATVPMTSVEKLELLGTQLEIMPAEGEMAVFLELGRMALPHVRAMLPSDPAELDAQLEQVGVFIANLKSDPAALPAAS
jgi:hypothetical protein